MIEQGRHEYNHIRPHSALNYRPPAPLATVSSLPVPAASAGRTAPVTAAGATLAIGSSRPWVIDPMCDLRADATSVVRAAGLRHAQGPD